MNKKVTIYTKKFSLSRWVLGGVAAVALVASALVAVLNVVAAGPTYTITYVNGSTTYTKTYDAGSTVTLDALPSGAIAWTNDNDSSAPNGKMAYVNYSHTETVNGVQTPINIPMTLTLNGNITLNANYGSYANGLGPRLIQYHLELKFFDMTNNVMMQYEQHYASINAPAGYYVDLPPSNYFGTLYSQVNNSGGLVNTGQVVSNWVNDSSYTGTANEPESLIYTPDQAIYVDPNNYNMVYDAMVTSTYNPSFAQTLPPDAPANPNSPDPVPTDADDSITFRISQANIPPASVETDLLGNSSYPVYGGTFLTYWDTDHQPNWHLASSPDVYMNWFSGQAQLTLSGLQASQAWGAVLPHVTFPNSVGGGTYAVLPAAVNVAGYTFYWDVDGTTIPLGSGGLTDDNSLPDYLSSNGITSATLIGGSHVFTLHYVPIPATVQLYVDGHTDSVVYDGASHSVSGYDVYNCSTATNIDQDNLLGSGCALEGTSPNGGPVTLANGDVLNFTNTSGNSNTAATSTDVGTYPMVLTASDFSVTGASGDLYNLTMSCGGLTITQKDLSIVVTPPIDPNTPGDQTVVVTPSNPGDLAPGHEIITPGTGITNNGDGTSTTDGNTNVVVNVDGDGNITYTDPNTGQPIPYDPTQPNGGIIWIGDTNNNDPNTGLPNNVTNNYTPNNVLPNPIKKSGSNNNNNDNNGGGAIVPSVPNTGFSK